MILYFDKSLSLNSRLSAMQLCLALTLLYSSSPTKYTFSQSLTTNKSIILSTKKQSTKVIQKRESKPNVIFISVDDLRPELSVYGNKMIKTPNFDRLSNMGITFNNAYCQIAVCAPSRASVLTGLRPDSNKVLVLGQEFRQLLPNALTIPQQFKKAGYYTVSIGKIFHNKMPDSISFDEPDLRPDQYLTKDMVDRDAESFYYDDEIKKEHTEVRLQRLAANPNAYGGGWGYGRFMEVADCQDDDLYDGAQTSLAIKTISRIKQKKEPFFLDLGYYRPHLPFVAPKKYWNMYDPMKIPMAENDYVPYNSPSVASYNNYELRGCYDLEWVKDPITFRMPESTARALKHGYYASVTYVDALIGRLLDYLEKEKMLDNTIIVLWGDHGWKLGEHNSWGKFTNFVNDTRIPLIAYAPSIKNKGLKTDELVEAIDMYPTLCDLAGIEIPDYLHGTSFKKLMNEKGIEWKNAVFNQFLRMPGQSVDSDKNHYIGYSMIVKDYHYVEWYYYDWQKKLLGDLLATELYNLKKDPAENHNIAIYPQNRDLIKKLSKQLNKGNGWRKEQNALKIKM